VQLEEGVHSTEIKKIMLYLFWGYRPAVPKYWNAELCYEWPGRTGIASAMSDVHIENYGASSERLDEEGLHSAEASMIDSWAGKMLWFARNGVTRAASYRQTAASTASSFSSPPALASAPAVGTPAVAAAGKGWLVWTGVVTMAAVDANSGACNVHNVMCVVERLPRDAVEAGNKSRKFLLRAYDSMASRGSAHAPPLSPAKRQRTEYAEFTAPSDLAPSSRSATEEATTAKTKLSEENRAGSGEAETREILSRISPPYDRCFVSLVAILRAALAAFCNAEDADDRAAAGATGGATAAAEGQRGEDRHGRALTEADVAIAIRYEHLGWQMRRENLPGGTPAYLCNSCGIYAAWLAWKFAVAVLEYDRLPRMLPRKLAEVFEHEPPIVLWPHIWQVARREYSTTDEVATYRVFRDVVTAIEAFWKHSQEELYACMFRPVAIGSETAGVRTAIAEDYHKSLAHIISQTHMRLEAIRDVAKACAPIYSPIEDGVSAATVDTDLLEAYSEHESHFKSMLDAAAAYDMCIARRKYSCFPRRAVERTIEDFLLFYNIAANNCNFGYRTSPPSPAVAPAAASEAAAAAAVMCAAVR
jgi:hypothetical protein